MSLQSQMKNHDRHIKNYYIFLYSKFWTLCFLYICI